MDVIDGFPPAILVQLGAEDPLLFKTCPDVPFAKNAVVPAAD